MGTYIFFNSIFPLAAPLGLALPDIGLSSPKCVHTYQSVLLGCLILDNLSIKWNDRWVPSIQEGIYFPISMETHLQENVIAGTPAIVTLGCSAIGMAYNSVSTSCPLWQLTTIGFLPGLASGVQEWPQPGLAWLPLWPVLSSFTTLSGPFGLGSPQPCHRSLVDQPVPPSQDLEATWCQCKDLKVSLFEGSYKSLLSCFAGF